MPATIRGFFQGIAYAAPQIIDLISRQQYYNALSNQYDLEQQKFELERRKYDEGATLRAEQLEQAKTQGKMLSLAYDLEDKFGETTRDLEKRLLTHKESMAANEAKLSGETLESQIKAKLKEYDMMEAQILALNAQANSAEAQRKLATLDFKVKAMKTLGHLMLDPTLGDTVLKADTLEDMRSALMNANISDAARLSLMGLSDTMAGVLFNDKANLANLRMQLVKEKYSEKEIESMMKSAAEAQRAQTMDIFQKIYGFTFTPDKNSSGVSGDFNKTFSEKAFNANALLERGYGSDISAGWNATKKARSAIGGISGYPRKAATAATLGLGNFYKSQIDATRNAVKKFGETYKYPPTKLSPYDEE